MQTNKKNPWVDRLQLLVAYAAITLAINPWLWPLIGIALLLILIGSGVMPISFTVTTP
jgi:hypothetical protein